MPAGLRRGDKQRSDDVPVVCRIDRGAEMSFTPVVATGNGHKMEDVLSCYIKETKALTRAYYGKF